MNPTHKPLTAMQYLDRNQARRNRHACAMIELREAAFRWTCYLVATVSLCGALGNLIHAIILLNR